MTELKIISDKVREKLVSEGAAEYAYSVSESEKHEFNTEGGAFSLLRTIYDNLVSVSVIDGGRRGSASGHDLTDAGIGAVVGDAIAGAASAQEDPANVIAEKQEARTFRSGPLEPDMEGFFSRLRELLDTIEKDYPLIRIMTLVASYTKSREIYANSSGTEFEKYGGAYEVDIEFAGNDGENTTGFSYASFLTHDLDRPLIELGGMRNQLSDAERGLQLTEIEEKFTGTVILTPMCLGEFAYSLIQNYLGSTVIMEGTSRWLDRIGEKVASDKVNLRLSVSDPRIVGAEPYTRDGYPAEDVWLIEGGVLKSHQLSLYAARKTGRPVTRNGSENMVIDGGDVPLADIIASVDRGLIVGGFSGGEPGANGEFSGVAKNAFYIKDGKIAGAVRETMINGNLEEVFRNVAAVSSEVLTDGMCAFPYMAVTGVVISGKQ